ncbi:MAG: SDR family NAD(P)-dependent oxidoreductase [Planctomycetota bacterium]|nr:MAG: SDR family NAD(P)-dependent oxidoreductase [Planctomycetota bacterium]
MAPRPFQRVLITGAAGFIGSHLAERCLAAGAEVTGVDNFDAYYDPALKERNLAAARQNPRFHLIRGDIRDRPLIHRLIAEQGCDVVAHLAARAGVRPSLADPVLYMDVNVLGTTVILEALRQRPDTRFVFASSSSVYGGLTHTPFRETDEVSRPVSPYAASKKAGEVLCAAWNHLYGIPIAALRFFTAYGPRQRPDMAIASFAQRMLQGQPIPIFGDGSSARDYTYVDDIVDGVVRAMERCQGFEIYNLGESQTTRLDELVRLLGEALDVQPQIERRPPQPGDVLITCADISKARAALGYRPATGLREGLRRHADWLRRP